MHSRKLMVAAGLVLAVTGCGGPVAHDPNLPAPTSPVAATTPAPRPVVAQTTKPPAKKPPAKKPPSTTKAPVTDKRYDTCKEVKDHDLGPYQQGKDPEYYWYRDGDGDGVACE